MQHLKRENLYKSIAACILECASTIRNKDVETQLLAACKSFKEEKTCSLTRRQIACLLANIFLGTFKPANPKQPNVSLAT
jgi:Poly (ADP-ribose) glycohydrolase (PARG)